MHVSSQIHAFCDVGANTKVPRPVMNANNVPPTAQFFIVTSHISIRESLPLFLFLYSFRGRSVAPLEFELLLSSPQHPASLPRLRFRPQPLVYRAYTLEIAAGTPEQKPLHNNSSRLQDIVSRLGEICLSPELAHIMLFPVHANAFQDGILNSCESFPETRRQACFDPAAILHAMDNAALPISSACLAQSAHFLAKFQRSILPPPTLVSIPQASTTEPIRICAWKLDLPSRVCLLDVISNDQQSISDIIPTTAALNEGLFVPHALPKVLLEERSRRASPSGIHLLSPDAATGDSSAIRSSLLHYAQNSLVPHKARGHGLDTTLEEALACLILPPRNASDTHTEINLHQEDRPVAWNKDHIDSR